MHSLQLGLAFCQTAVAPAAAAVGVVGVSAVLGLLVRRGYQSFLLFGYAVVDYPFLALLSCPGHIFCVLSKVVNLC